MSMTTLNEFLKAIPVFGRHIFLLISENIIAIANVTKVWFLRGIEIVDRFVKKSEKAARLLVDHLFKTKVATPIITDGNNHETKFHKPDKPDVNHPRFKWFHWLSNENHVPVSLEPEKSVHIEILHDPFPEVVKADIVFIHGLHGSLYNTWKQGLWSYRKEVRSSPLKHMYSIEDKTEDPECSQVDGSNELESTTWRKNGLRQSNNQHDHLLENITDLLNNIDDTIKQAKNGNIMGNEKPEPYSPCWPRDWLPKDCPGVRVIAVNYTTDPFLWRPVWIRKRIRSSMTQRSQQMEDMLIEHKVGQRPIVWVGHSKGGLFIKQMLVDAQHSQDHNLSGFLKQTKGIMFYSVPHRGSSLAHWNLPLLRQSVEITEVKKNCREVLDLNKKFLKLYKEKLLSAEVFSFVETIMTFMFFTNVRVVSVDSADLGLGSFQGVNIDHREICKPLNRDCFLYRELTNLIERVIYKKV